MVTIQPETRKEMIYLLILLVLEITILKIIFHKESFLIVVKLALSLFWLFILPGFMIMYFFVEQLNFIERIVAGITLGMAFLGVVGYNLGVLGLLIKYQVWILPVIAIGLGIFALIKNQKISF